MYLPVCTQFPNLTNLCSQRWLQNLVKLVTTVVTFEYKHHPPLLINKQGGGVNLIFLG